MSKSVHHLIPWPADGSPADFEVMTTAVRRSLKSAYSMRRKARGKDIPYTGLNVGDLHVSLPVDQSLSAESLAYAKDDQGRDALDTLIGIAVQLGIEQGRRLQVKKIEERINLVKALNPGVDLSLLT